MALVSPYLLIIAFNVNGLESPIKGGEWLDGIKKSRPIWCWPGGFCSVAIMSDSLWPRGLQHARLPCPSRSPGNYPGYQVAEDNVFF